MSSKVDDLWSWLYRNSTQGPDLLNGHDARLDAQHALQDGVNKAQNSINAGFSMAAGQLAPYQQAGDEDFGNYRDLTTSGYFDTPWGGTYQPLSYKPAAYNPGQYDPATASFTGAQNRQPWAPPGPAQLLSQPGLPPMPSMPHSSMGAPGGAGGGGDLVSQIKAMLEGTHPGPQQPGGGGQGGIASHMPPVVGAVANTLRPTMPSVSGTTHAVLELGRGIRQLANGDIIDGTGRILKSGLATLDDVKDSLVTQPVEGLKRVYHAGHEVAKWLGF